MKPLARLGVFTLALAVAFAAALGVGRVVGLPGWAAGDGAAPVADGHGGGAEPGGHGAAPDDDGAAPDDDGAAPEDGAGGGVAGEVPGGLQVAQDGYRLVLDPVVLRPGTATPVRLRIINSDGTVVTAFTPTHERNLHLIVVRRDLSGYQHLHPTMSPDGVWTVAVTVPAAGFYRVFADFQPARRDQALTLGADVAAPGDLRATPLPPPARTATVDGYRVDLDGVLTPGTASRITLRVTLHGRPVVDLRPYLGAYGHLVALRDGDLAYLHVHPEGAPGDGRTAAGPDIVFSVDVPSDGTYRLFLDFSHGDVVRTAQFTASAGPAHD